MKKLSALFITLLVAVSLFAQERVLQIGGIEIPIESNIEYQFVPEQNSVKLMIDKVEEHSFPMPVNIEFITRYAISVTGVSLNASTLTLIQGSDATLIATITPPDATNKNLEWTSSNKSVATVTNNGKIITLGVGETIITVTTVDGEFKASCVITVNPPKVPVSGIVLSHTTLHLNRGDVETIEATITPPDASNQAVQWKSADESVATVSNAGKVTAVGAGATTIIATTDDGGKTAQCNVTVKIPVTSISIVQTDAEIAVGKSYQLDVDISPENATNQTIVWESSDESVATVNHNGKVTALTVGSTTITATVEGEDKSSTSTITVYQPDVLVTNVSLNVHEVHVSVGDESKLIATILPPNATNKTLAWSSSDEAIATVDAEGNVEAIASGEAYIKVLAADGTYADSCKFVVSTIAVAVEGVSLSSKTLALSVGKSISIEATVTPSNATNKDVIWSSTDNSVATVDATGKITAVGAGQAIITATTVNNAKTASCTVTVRVPVTGIAITNVTDSIEKGKTHQFEVEFSPENATNKTITWKSLDESVATITQYGKVTAVATGTVTITVTTEDGNHIATHEVTVFEPDVEVLGVVLNTHSVELSEGSNTSLIAMVSPPNASNTAVVWTSADKSIAVVDSQGKISALKEGETYIKVTTEDGNYSDSCLLVVNTIAVPVEEVQVSDKIMYVRVNEAATITATVLPEFASNKSVVWSSSDETIASITDDGEITAYKEGEVLLIVIAQDGGHADSCTLIVNNEFIMHNAFVYIPVVNPATGKTWLDRNLGASQVATSSTDERAYGDLYQWGRQADGHEKRNSGISATLSNSDAPDHDKFILINVAPNDWRNPQNNKLWQGPVQNNNPCPAGYKVPTQAEWQEELNSWDSENDMGAFASILKLPMAGYRSNASGEISGTETAGRYWASTIVGTSAHRLYVIDNKAVVNTYSRGIGYSVRCIKDESIYVGSVTLDKTTANIEKTDSLQLTATVLPANATNKNLSWSSSDESVATVDNTGKVSALQVGTTIITATTEDGGYTAECEVTVFVVGVESIEISHTTLELEKGEKDTLRVIILPENAYNKTVTWESLDESVATVDDNGNVTAISVGTTTITAITEDGGHTAECELTVVNITVKGIDISPKSIEIGVNNTKTLQFTVLPEDAFNKTVIWSSYDESIATVDDNGNVTAISVGDATITATSEDGGHADSCKVTVIPSSGTFIDERDNTEYKWVLIGEQVWMAENLAYLPQVNHPIDEGSATEPMYYVYDYYGTNVEDAKATDNYKTYGVLYNPTAAQDACPNGWYVPERNDFDMLTDFIGETEHGGKLKAVGTEFWQAPNEGATDEYGFNALPGGRFYYGLSNPFSGLGESAIWRYGSGSGNLLYNLYYNNTNILYSNSNWAYAPSIRCIKADGTSVESVSLSAASKEIVVHESFVLTATITPSRVVNRTIAWSSSDETVATVDALGTVTGISEGVATIIVTTEDGGHTDSCEVTVRFVSVESVDISDAILEIGKGTTLQLTATVLPADATNKTITWTSSDESIATVDENGNVTAIDAGNATITATSEDGGYIYTANCELTVFVSVESIEISDATLELEKGATKQLTVTVLPADATNKTIIWESSDESIATVDENGNVTAIDAGNVTITATTEDGGHTAECEVTVFISVESIEISDATLELEKGATKQLTVTVLPADATNKTIIWESSDESIATVDENGNVTAIDAGNVTITATTEDGGYTAECEVTVFIISVESIEISDATLEIGKGTTLQLIATVLPANATNKNLSWSSSDESIVTVDADGLITAIEVGSATIIVQSDNGIIDSCEFTVLTELIIHDGFNYGVVTNPATGQTWLDRNLGASRVATSIDDELSFGDLYQWGRGTDGHEKRNSATTSTLSDNDTPGHGDFITTNSASNDWRSSQNDNLWQGVDSINNPCPDGYRIPTKAEWTKEYESWSSNGSGDEKAFNSPLKIPAAGFRYNSGGGYPYTTNLWCNNVSGSSVMKLYADGNSNVLITATSRATGIGVRCIRHEEPATSVSLDKATVEVEITKTIQLIATVLPIEASNKTVMWSSSDETVATVDENGTITALKIGSTTITATTVDGGFEDSCIVTIIPLMGTFIDSRDNTEYKWVQIGEQKWIAENMRYLPQVHVLSDESIDNPRYYVQLYDATSVSAAKATDEFNTYGVLYNWQAALQACPQGWHTPDSAEWRELTNYVGTEINLLKSTHGWANGLNGTDDYRFTALPGSYYKQGSEVDLTYYGYWWNASEFASEGQNVTFMYNIDTALFMALPKNNKQYVRCIEGKVDPTELSLNLTDIEIVKNFTVQPTLTILPRNASKSSVLWSSADESVATVDSDGIITAVEVGTTTIYASTYNGESKDSCSIVVIDSPNGTMIDSRDGTEYNWVRIGEQVWLAENMAYLPAVHQVSEQSITEPKYYVYDYNGTNVEDAKATDNYKTYGALYNWSAALAACPKGWHLPNNAEWEELINFAGGGSTAAERLKSSTAWSVNNLNGTDEYGFSILPAGENYENSFGYLHSFASFWLADEYSNSYAIYTFIQNQISHYFYEKYQAVSVRCIKN